MARIDFPSLSFPVEFRETYNAAGTQAFVSWLVSPAMPRGMSAQISSYYGQFRLRTKAHGNGSIRFRNFKTYEEAQAAALHWLQRKVKEAA